MKGEMSSRNTKLPVIQPLETFTSAIEIHYKSFSDQTPVLRMENPACNQKPNMWPSRTSYACRHRKAMQTSSPSHCSVTQQQTPNSARFSCPLHTVFKARVRSAHAVQPLSPPTSWALAWHDLDELMPAILTLLSYSLSPSLSLSQALTHNHTRTHTQTGTHTLVWVTLLFSCYCCFFYGLWITLDRSILLIIN